MKAEMTRRDFMKAAAVTSAAAAAMSAMPVLADEEVTAEAPAVEISETLETEVVIIGLGAAGVQAALTVAEAGVKAIVLEKGFIGAANGSRAGGPALAETARQAEEGATVTVKTLFDHMYNFSHGTVNGLLLHKAIEQGSRAYNHFADNGVRMGLRKDAYGVGFRARHNFQNEEGKQVSGAPRFQPLVDKFVEMGGTVLEFTEGQRLLKDENGAICGVIAYNNDEEYYIQINCKAVLVCCGGYLGNDERLKEHFGDMTVFPLGNTLSDGKGYDMVLEAGGTADRNWAICANEFGGATPTSSRTNNPSPNLNYAVYGQLMVNMNGDRFMNEQYLSDDALSIGGECSLREGIYYSILDQEAFEKFGDAENGGMYKYYGSPAEWWAGSQSSNAARGNAEALEKDIENGWAFKADTLEELADHFNLPNLPKTVADYNAMCEAGEDTMFGKSAYLMKALATPPYYAFQYYASAWCTFGGVKTDDKCRALTSGMEVIPGLYVAGVDNGSLYTSPYYDNEGASLGLAYTSGIVAGDAIAEYVRA